MTSNSSMTTVCLHTKDAVARNDSEITFELNIDRPNVHASRIALASLEFPMVQWTIEEDWNRLYMSEGIALSAGHNDVGLEVDGVCADVVLPLRLNRVVRTGREEGGILVETEYPHALWTNEGACLVPRMSWAEVRVAATSRGDVSLADSPDRVQYVSDREFVVRGATEFQGGHLFVPTIPSPSALSDLLSAAASHAHPSVSCACTFDAERNRFVVRVRRRDAGEAPVRVRIRPTPLSTWMGIHASDVTLDSASRPIELPTDSFRGWDFAELPCGFYSPCHRPMSIGQPMKLTQEVELAMNRLYFPMSERVGDGATTVHFLVFTDPSQSTHLCPVPFGRYGPDALCAFLEDEMTRVAQPTTPGVQFSVTHENDRFSFACEVVGSDGSVAARPFSILFNHSKSIDAQRLGFPPGLPLVGGSTYTASERTRVCDVRTLGSQPRMHPSNVFRMSDVVQQKRFRIHATAMQNLTALVDQAVGGDGVCICRTFMGPFPFSHGFREGDVVLVGHAASRRRLLRATVDSSGEAVDGEAEPFEGLSQVGASSAVVLRETADPCALILYAPFLNQCPTGKVVQLSCPPEPLNLCFDGERSMRASMLGFDKTVVQWGVDGSVEGDGGHRVPPSCAPGCTPSTTRTTCSCC